MKGPDRAGERDRGQEKEDAGFGEPHRQLVWLKCVEGGLIPLGDASGATRAEPGIMPFGQLAGCLVALLFICPDDAADGFGLYHRRRLVVGRRIIRHDRSISQMPSKPIGSPPVRFPGPAGIGAIAGRRERMGGAG